MMETYRLPKYVDAASRKFIMATLSKHITRYRSFETYFAIPRRLYEVFKEQCGKVAEESIVVTDEIRCKYKSFGYHLRLIDALLRRVSPDVVVTANIDDFVTLALAYPLYSSRIKRVVWQDKSYYSHSKRLLFKTFRHSLGKRTDIVAARNLHSCRLVRELLGVVPELIPIGIDCEVYKPLKPTYSRSTDILFVGRASWEKGVDIFVETVLILDRISKHRIKVKIVTNGGPLEELFNLLKMKSGCGSEEERAMV